MTFQQTYTYVLAEATEDELVKLSKAVSERQKMLRQIKAAVNSLELTVGSKAKLTGIAPKYLSGVMVTVVGKKNSKMVIEFDDTTYTGRFGKQVRVSPAQLERV